MSVDLSCISIIPNQLSILTCAPSLNDENKEQPAPSKTQTHVKMIYLLDNSASMGSLSKDCAKAFGQIHDVKYDHVKMHRGVLILFATDAQIQTRHIKSSQDIDTHAFPQQGGSTNITKGVACALDFIQKDHNRRIAKKESFQMHYILVYLSDGGHNEGPPLSQLTLSNFRNSMVKNDSDVYNVKLSILVAGISNPDTGLGMLIKTEMETVSLPYLDNVYFAPGAIEVESVLSHIQDGFKRAWSSGYSIVNLKLENGAMFVSDRFSSDASCVMSLSSSSGNKQYFLVKHQQQQQHSECSPPFRVLVNGCLCESVKSAPLSYADITGVIDSVTPKLAQKNVGSGANSIREQVTLLERLIQAGEGILETIRNNTVKSNESIMGIEDIGKIAIKPAERLAMLKRIQMASMEFKTEKNKLKALLATVENNSAKQAEYLNGITKKYAAKALERSAPISSKDIFDSIQSVADKMTQLESDRKQEEEEESKESKGQEESTSILSLNTALEQCQEWMHIKGKTLSDFENDYAFLVFCGFIGYPVKFQHNNAVQMDPFQTTCLDVEPYLADSPSIMLSNQLKNRSFKSLIDPNKIITDVLVLVSPSCPNHSLLTMRSMLYKLLASVTLTRDLYMFNPQMTFSMHAHALIRAIDLSRSDRSDTSVTFNQSYIQLALHILYSAHKLGIALPADRKQLLVNWIEDYGTLTQSEKDNCHHPVQLLLLLGIADIGDTSYDNCYIPLINLLNETLSRTIRIKLAGIRDSQQPQKQQQPQPSGLVAVAVASPSSPSLASIAQKLAQRMLRITAETAPKPNMDDVMAAEPSIEDVRNSCPNVDPNDPNLVSSAALESITNCKSIQEYVNTTLLPYVHAFHFCLQVRSMLMNGFDEKSLSQSSSSCSSQWNQLAANIEQNGLEAVAKTVATKMNHNDESLKSVYAYLHIPPNNIQMIALNMFLQASLYPDSSSRSDILDYDVMDKSTFRKMTVDLMMDFYGQACAEKRRRYLATIGDVTYAAALKANAAQFESFLGFHTHSLSRQKFRALLKATKGNSEKKQVFLNKSCESVDRCFRKSYFLSD